MKEWVAPKLIAEEMILSQAVASDCINVNGVIVYCEGKNNGSHPTGKTVYYVGEYYSYLNGFMSDSEYNNGSGDKIIQFRSEHPTSQNGHHTVHIDLNQTISTLNS